MSEEKTTGKPARKRKQSQYSLALEKVQQAQEAQPTEQEQPDSQPSSHPAIETSEQSAVQTANHSDIQPEIHTDTKTSKQQEVKTPKQKAIQTAKQETVKPLEHPDSQTEKQQRTKATYYLEMDDLIAVDTIQTKRYRATGKKPEKSELVSEAIKLLSKQENI